MQASNSNTRSEIFKRALDWYSTYFEEKGALLRAGATFSELDSYMQDENWRKAVQIINAQKFGEAIKALERQINDPTVPAHLRGKAAETMANYFAPGAAVELPATQQGTVDWPKLVENGQDQ